MPLTTNQPRRLNREYAVNSASPSSKTGIAGKSSQCAKCGQDADESNNATAAHTVDAAAIESGSVSMIAASKKSLLSKADWIALAVNFGILVIPQIFEVSDFTLLLIVFIQLMFVAIYAVLIVRRFRASQFYKMASATKERP